MKGKPYSDYSLEKKFEYLKDWQPKTKKLKNIDGKFFRKRRGIWVEVPLEWLGHVPDNNTKAKRQPISRRTRKNKNKST